MEKLAFRVSGPLYEDSVVRREIDSVTRYQDGVSRNFVLDLYIVSDDPDKLAKAAKRLQNKGISVSRFGYPIYDNRGQILRLDWDPEDFTCTMDEYE